MKIARAASVAISAVIGMALSGCATTPNNPKDPMEGFNRAMFELNDGVDKAVVKPVAKGYVDVVPATARDGVSNFFGNIGDVFIGVNDALQGKPSDAATDLGRVAVNSTVGILGFMDVATDMGLEKHEEDFGLTFGHWGVDSGPYVFLPIFGPRTVRDTAGLAVDIYADPIGRYANVPTRNVLVVTRFISVRASLLPADKVIEDAALDKYSYIRDAYLQRRRSQVYDGKPPPSKDTAE